MRMPMGVLGYCIAVGIVVGPLRAQDVPTRAVDAGGITFQVPGTWKDIPTTNTMRKLQMEIPKSGDSATGEMVLFVFPGGAGTVPANIERWQGQFKSAEGSAVKAETKKAAGKNVEVTRVALAGTYTDPFSGKGSQPGYRLLGAIAVTPKGSYFLKLVGPAETVAAAEPDFDKLIASVEIAP